jgi:hypothetical protein
LRAEPSYMRSGTSRRIRFIGWRTEVLVEEFADCGESAGSIDSTLLKSVQRRSHQSSPKSIGTKASGRR